MTSANRSRDSSRFSTSALIETVDTSRFEPAPRVAPRLSSVSEISSAPLDVVPSSSIPIAIRAVPGRANWSEA